MLARRVPVSAFGRYHVSLQRKKCCQQIVGLNDESFSIAMCVNAIEESALGQMLGDAVRPAPACNRSAMISQYFTRCSPHAGTVRSLAFLASSFSSPPFRHLIDTIFRLSPRGSGLMFQYSFAARASTMSK
jgi:hypothetical protein